jgi:hypothetical protein
MEKVKIKKAKIKDSMFLEVEYTEQLPGHNKKDRKESSTVPVHQDMKDAFYKLHVHLAVLCDEVKTPKRGDIESSEFEGFIVGGFSIGGSGENEGVTISGSKEGKYGTVNLNTPFTKYESSEYPFVAELNACIESCVYEIEQYLFDGKRAPEAQMELFQEDDLVVEETN